jgi:integrase
MFEPVPVPMPIFSQRSPVLRVRPAVVRVRRTPPGSHEDRIGGGHLRPGATLLLASRGPVKVVSERIGHKSVTVTLTVYGNSLGNCISRE